MKTCLFDGCELPIFSHGYCKRHQHMRTDDKKPKHTSFKPCKPRSVKKHTNTKSKENNGFKSSICFSWGFTTQREMFEHIWDTRPHVCQFTGADLDLVPKYQWSWMFMHILRKGTYRYYKYNPDNIVLGHPNFHLAADNFTEEERQKHPEWLFDRFFEMQEQKKQEYKQFLIQNQL